MIQQYIDMGFTEKEAEFIDTYPRLYPLASTIGISKDKIDEYFSKMNESAWIRTQTNHNNRQTHMKAIWMRLEHCNESLDLKRYKHYSFDQIVRLVGTYNTRFMIELLQVI